jgi:hypothetical protein
MVFLAGCCPTVSVNPLSDPVNPVADQRLLGAWHSRIEDSDIFLHFGKNPDNTIAIESVEHRGDGRMALDGPMVCFSTVLECGNFLNIEKRYLVRGDEEGASEYIIVMYDFTDKDRLSLYLWDEKKIEDDITAGKAEGTVTETPAEIRCDKGMPVTRKTKCVKLTGDPESLAAYFKAAGVKSLFNQPSGVFERIADPTDKKN